MPSIFPAMGLHPAHLPPTAPTSLQLSHAWPLITPSASICCVVILLPPSPRIHHTALSYKLYIISSFVCILCFVAWCLTMQYCRFIVCPTSNPELIFILCHILSSLGSIQYFYTLFLLLVENHHIYFTCRLFITRWFSDAFFTWCRRCLSPSFIVYSPSATLPQYCSLHSTFDSSRSLRVLHCIRISTAISPQHPTNAQHRNWSCRLNPSQCLFIAIVFSFSRKSLWLFFPAHVSTPS